NKVGGVAHREMISFGDHYLTRGWKQLLPPLLETKGIIALAKNGEHRRVRQRSGKSPRNSVIQVVTAASISHISMKGAAATRANACTERFATGFIQVPADAKR